MDLLFWLYLTNLVVLVIHEMDSAYWEEWKLLGPNQQDGINGFLLGHIPLFFVVFLGLIFVYEDIVAGFIISFLLSAGGVFAFFFHFYHLRKGRQEFTTVLSKTLIITTFLLSIAQIVVTVRAW
jgi:hypothetical protein